MADKMVDWTIDRPDGQPVLFVLHLYNITYIYNMAHQMSVKLFTT
jgi:hypothetical protein